MSELITASTQRDTPESTHIEKFSEPLQSQPQQNARRLLYFELAQLISGASSTEELKKHCETATEALGYDYYLFGGYYPMVESVVMSSTFPAKWHAEYEENGYIAIDPTVKHWWTSTNPIVWREVEYSEGKTGDLERMCMEQASVSGLRSGISVPVHGSGAEGGGC